MKIRLLTIIVAATLGNQALAADLRTPVYKAPVASPAFDWSGFYIGAHAVVNGYDLLTLDAKIYHAAFPTLKIISV